MYFSQIIYLATASIILSEKYKKSENPIVEEDQEIFYLIRIPSSQDSFSSKKKFFYETIQDNASIITKKNIKKYIRAIKKHRNYTDKKSSSESDNIVSRVIIPQEQKNKDCSIQTDTFGSFCVYCQNRLLVNSRLAKHLSMSEFSLKEINSISKRKDKAVQATNETLYFLH